MRFNQSGRTSLPGDSGSPVVAKKARDCPTCSPQRVPIGIVNAGNEADPRARSESGPINADLYFASVDWALDANNRVCIPSHAEGYKGRGTAIKGLRERGYVHNVPADVDGCYWPTLTPAGIEKARALRAALGAK